MIAAATVDGFIGRSADDRSFDWTSPEDARFYVETIKNVDVIIMGSRTFRSVKRHPRGAHYVIFTSKPEDFVNPRPEVITTWATNLSPAEVIESLAKQGHKRIAICGGSSIYGQFLKAGLVQRLLLTVEPIIFGEGVKLFAEKIEVNLELVQTRQLNERGTILFDYEVKHVES